jgi:hypothetical protein
MAVLSGQQAGWGDVELPCVVRYRRNAFVAPLIICGLLLLAAVTCTYGSGKWFAGVPFAVLGITTLMLTLNPLRHVRGIDCLRIDREALTLYGTDGRELRIKFTPGAEFLVRYDYFYRSIVYATAAKNYRDAQHVMVDVLDVPRGRNIYGLCQLLNDLGSGDVRPGASARAVQRSDDWYREPARLSRAVFAAASFGLLLLFACTIVVLSLLLQPLASVLARPMLWIIKLGLGALFIYPAYRFLCVGRLRDLGEGATHRNANGLVFRSARGFNRLWAPLRLFLAPGTPGRNPFGPAPRF